MLNLTFPTYEINKLWPIFKKLIDSPWSNIRSLVYAIISYWVRDEISLKDDFFIQNLIENIKVLLISKESECRKGGLNILSSLCGLNSG